MPVISLRMATRSACGLVSHWSAAQPHDSEHHLLADTGMSGHTGRHHVICRSTHEPTAGARKMMPFAQLLARQGRQHAPQLLRTMAAVSGVVRIANAATLVGASPHAADDHATMSSDKQPVSESNPQDSMTRDTNDTGSLHSDGADSSRSESGGKRAGAFLRLPMVQLAKEQLSSAQRAARRTPYSRKLKNEAQRERNRCEPCICATGSPCWASEEEQALATEASKTTITTTRLLPVQVRGDGGVWPSSSLMRNMQRRHTFDAPPCVSRRRGFHPFRRCNR